MARPRHHGIQRQGLKGWASQLHFRIHRAQRVRDLQVQGAVILRSHILAIRFLAHFDTTHRVTPAAHIAEQVGIVGGSIVKHADWQQNR